MENVKFHFPSYQSTSRHDDRILGSSSRPLFESSSVSERLHAFEVDSWNSHAVLSPIRRCQALRQACLPSQTVLHPEKAFHLEARRRFYFRWLPTQSPHDQQ